MTAFAYKALTAAGKEVSGVDEAESAASLRSHLRSKNLVPVSVSELVSKRAGGKTSAADVSLARIGRQIKLHETVLFTRQLATLLASGLQVVEALTTAAAQSERPAVQKMITAIRERVQEGHPLASGFALFPKVFSTMYCAMVRAGEASGQLDTVLERLADYTESQQEMRDKLTSAAVYPCVMVVMSVAVVIFLLAYVVPQLVTLFQSSGQVLPLITRVMIALSDGVKSYGLLMFMLFAGCLWGFNLWLRLRSNRCNWHKLLLRLPMLGKLFLGLSTARFSRTFGILLSAGVPVLESIKTATAVVSMLPVQDSLQQTYNRVKEGGAIHLALRETRYFTPMSVHLIATGEASGSLDKMLVKAASVQEKEVQRFVDRLMSLFEPLVTVAMGGVILLIVMSVLLPIFSLSQHVN